MLLPILFTLFYDHVVFVFLSLDILGGFYVLDIVNSATLKIGVHVSFKMMNFSRSKPGKGLQDHMIHLCLVFQRTSVLFPLTASPVPFPPQLWEESLVCTSSAVLFFEDLFHKATVISVRWYLIVVWWHWFNNYWCWVFFHVLLLFYTLWVQVTTWNWLLETWPCLEIFSHNLPQDIFWRQVSFTALSY